MAQAAHVRLDAQFDAGAAARKTQAMPDVSFGDVRLAIYHDLAAIERDWRAFEAQADGTVFQTFDWLATWQRHIGALAHVQPVIVVGRDEAGAILFLFPLSVRAGGFCRELTWFGSDLCDYNGPLLAKDFSTRINPEQFRALWREILRRLQAEARFAFDMISLDKMPEMVGAQANPLCALGGTLNPSGAYLVHLSGDWDAFYTAARSSATRRRDRTKRKKLAEFGEINFVTADGEDEILKSLDVLMQQKSRAFARMGVTDLFAKPGHADFYRALATDPYLDPFVHVSRLDVGGVAAAANLAVVHHGRYYHLLASYSDGEVSRFGPGAAHLHDLLQYAIGRGCTIFDFTIGDERYKRDWCDTELLLYHYVAPVTWRGLLVTAPKLAAQKLKRWIKQTPFLWAAAVKVRGLMGKLRTKGE